MSNGALYFGDWAGNFHAVNGATGTELWNQFLGVSPPAQTNCGPGLGVSAQAVVSGQTVYAAGGDSSVYAMDAGTGQIQWQVRLADPNSGSYLWSSLMLYRNALYIGLASLTDCPLVRGGLARIPLDNPSRPQFAYLTTPDNLGSSVWSTPAIDAQNNLVYVTTGNSTDNVQDPVAGIYGSAVVALDATTLQIKSHYFSPLLADENDPDFGSSPTLFEAGGQQLLAANGKNGTMYVLHRPDLSLVWSYKLARDCDSPTLGCGSTSTPAFDGVTLVTGAGQPDGDSSPSGTVYAFDPANQKLLWTYAAPAPVLAPVTMTPGLVFVTSEQGFFVLDSATGKELWNDGGANSLFGQPVVANGVVYTGYVNGDLVAWAVPGGGAIPISLSAAPTALNFAATVTGGAPESQLVAIGASLPAAGFTVTSDSSWLTAASDATIVPANLTVQVATPSDPGLYNGNLTLTPSYGNPTTIPVALVVNPAPAPSSSGTVGAADFQSDPAPGSLISIFGTLAGESGGASNMAWPTSWDGITVNFNGVPAPLGYISPTQINAQVPFEVAPGNVQMTITSNGVTSLPVSLVVQASAPGIFVDANRRATALNQDYSFNTSANPAPTGSYISVYMTGQGAVTPVVPTGQAAPTGSFVYTVAKTTATLDGIDAPIYFSGLAPGYVGLAQVNLQIPSLPPGDHTLVVTIGGRASNGALISTK